MEGLNSRVNELVGQLKAELEVIQKQAAKAAELPEELKNLQGSAKDACRELEAVAASLKEAAGKFNAIVQILAEAQKATKEMESRIMEAVGEVNRKTEEAKDETQQVIKNSGSKLLGVIVIGLLLLAAGVAWIIAQQ